MKRPKVKVKARRPQPRTKARARSPEVEARKPINWSRVADMSPRRREDLVTELFMTAKPPPGVVPEGAATLAMDAQLRRAATWAAGAMDQTIIFSGGWAGGYGGADIGGQYSAFGQGLQFMGYPYLAQLALRAEYRLGVGTLATEMVRKGVEIMVAEQQAAEPAEANEPQLAGEGGKTPLPFGRGKTAGKKPPAVARDLMDLGRQNDEEAEQDAEVRARTAQVDERVTALEDEFKRLRVMDNLRAMVEGDGYYGRGHLYFDFDNASSDPEELKIPVGDGRNEITELKVTRDSLKYIKPVEAVWSYPANYNSNDPLSPDWYRPQMWFAMGKEVHASRFRTLIGNEVSDLFKPAFSFGGLSMTQLGKPAVDNWLRTRQSVSDLLHAFTVWNLASNLSTLDQPGGMTQANNRAQLFNSMRDNKGLLITDKETEELKNISVPLGGLSDLQAQSLEHICTVWQQPLVKYTGISPAGLNASSEGEIRVWYDLVETMQVKRLTDTMDRLFAFAQINLWGRVDPELSYKWRKLWSLDEKQEAEVRKIDAETDDILAAIGSIDQYESRTRVATDPNTPYKKLDLNKTIESPNQAAAKESLENLHNAGEGGSESGDFGAKAA